MPPIEMQLQEGRPDLAVLTYQQLPEDQRQLPANRHAYARALFKIGQFEKCSAVLDGLDANSREDPEVSYMEHVLKEHVFNIPVRHNSLERSFKSGAPRDLLLSIQESHHSYSYRGRQLVKNPFDMALYQLLLDRLKPSTIIEIGSKAGGSALWFADLCQSMQLDTRILSIDLERVTDLADPRISFLAGNGRDLAPLLDSRLPGLQHPFLVIEDADHTEETSTAVFQYFRPLLLAGDYLIIEDGIISDLYPSADGALSGPHRAIQKMLASYPGEFVIDATYCDFFGYNLTWNSNGWLRKAL